MAREEGREKGQATAATTRIPIYTFVAVFFCYTTFSTRELHNMQPAIRNFVPKMYTSQSFCTSPIATSMEFARKSVLNFLTFPLGASWLNDFEFKLVQSISCIYKQNCQIY